MSCVCMYGYTGSYCGAAGSVAKINWTNIWVRLDRGLIFSNTKVILWMIVVNISFTMAAIFVTYRKTTRFYMKILARSAESKRSLVRDTPTIRQSVLNNKSPETSTDNLDRPIGYRTNNSFMSQRTSQGFRLIDNISKQDGRRASGLPPTITKPHICH